MVVHVAIKWDMPGGSMTLDNYGGVGQDTRANSKHDVTTA